MTGPPTGARCPAPNDPMAVARNLLPAFVEDERHTLRHWRGSWMRWARTHWKEVEDKEIRSWAYGQMEHATYTVLNKDGAPEPRKWAPTKRKIADLMEALSAIIHLPADISPPAWTEDPKTDTGPIVACTNGLLYVTTRELNDLTPGFFNLVSVPFPYDPNAPAPTRWLNFLTELWPDDPDSIAVLQEWFGYVLSGRTDLHKMLLVIGPPRAGKGTLARVLIALIGKGNEAGPTLASLGTNFGLSPLLGKPLALISDARLSGRDTHTVVERLLSISGEDTIDVDRKYRDPWTGRLPARFMILSNELPNFGDASGAIATRFLVLTLQASWLGKENTGLEHELTAELPGILNWALDGLDRLTSRGRFTEPHASREAVVMMQDTASPMSAFVREMCDRGPAHQVPVDELFAAWKTWCADNERKAGTKQMFGRNLRAVVPQLRTVQPREGTARARVYTSLSLRPAQGWAHNGADRVPSRASGTETGVARDGTRSGPLWAQHHHGTGHGPLCTECGEPFTPYEPGQTTHPTC